jgi:hypothetical protein
MPHPVNAARGEESLMSSTVDVACPNCKKTLKIPPTIFGKKVKCKYCEHAFVVRDPAEEADEGDARPAKPTKPGAKPAAKPAASPPPPPAAAAAAPAATTSPFLDDDDDGKKVELIEEEDVPRCPHCAKELDPPDAKVCLHCGFNNLTRDKAHTKKLWAPTTEDWMIHLLPGIVGLVICICYIVWDFIVYFKMREWMHESFLEMDEKDATGKLKFYVPPGFFITFNLVISIVVCVPCSKLAWRRLVKEFQPPEKVKT